MWFAGRILTSYTAGNYTNMLTAGALSSSGGSNAAPASAVLSVSGGAVTGHVFLDNGAGGGTANDGISNGTEAPQSGITVSLGNCSGAAYASTLTDSTGNYTLTVPSSVAAGAPLCVSQTNQSGRSSTGASVGSTALPSGTAVAVSGTTYTYTRTPSPTTPDTIAFTFNGTSHSDLNFADVDNSTFGATTAKSSQPGNSVSYPHTFTARTAGSVTFSVTSSVSGPSVSGWTEKIMADPGCTGSLQAGAAVLYPPSVATGVVAGQQVCVIVQQMIPSNAPPGSTNDTRIQATLVLSDASPALTAPYTVDDVTTVSSSALELKKEVRNVTQGAIFGLNNEAKSGEVLEYRITYTNNGASGITSLNVADVTPNYTRFVSATEDTTPSGGDVSEEHADQPRACQPGSGLRCGAGRRGRGLGALALHRHLEPLGHRRGAVSGEGRLIGLWPGRGPHNVEPGQTSAVANLTPVRARGRARYGGKIRSEIRRSGPCQGNDWQDEMRQAVARCEAENYRRRTRVISVVMLAGTQGPSGGVVSRSAPAASTP